MKFLAIVTNLLAESLQLRKVFELFTNLIEVYMLIFISGL